jgi:hypothetical protein
MRKTPTKLVAIPIQRRRRDRSRRAKCAKRAVKAGVEATIRLADPAETVTSPKFKAR